MIPGKNIILESESASSREIWVSYMFYMYVDAEVTTVLLKQSNKWNCLDRKCLFAKTDWELKVRPP